MFCKNCGKEINDESIVCEFCKQDLSKPVKNKTELNSGLKSIRLNKTSCFLILIVCCFLVIGLIVLLNQPNKPNVEQIKTDFMIKILDNENYSISKFEIESDTDENYPQYTAIVDVVFDDALAEYKRKYEFIYYKYDEWKLEDIEDFEKALWVTSPLVCPNIHDFRSACLDRVLKTSSNGDFTYDAFDPVTSKTKEDLNNGEVIFVYSVKKKTEIQEISGEIEFLIVFDKNLAEWKIESFSYADSYKKHYDLIRTWQGDGYPYNFEGNEKYKVNFMFEVTKCENKNIEGVLHYNNLSYTLSGTYADRIDGHSVVLNLENEEENKKIELLVYLDDGRADADIDISYHPDNLIYFAYLRTKFYDVEMLSQ